MYLQISYSHFPPLRKCACTFRTRVFHPYYMCFQLPNLCFPTARLLLAISAFAFSLTCKFHRRLTFDRWPSISLSICPSVTFVSSDENVTLQKNVDTLESFVLHFGGVTICLCQLTLLARQNLREKKKATYARKDTFLECIFDIQMVGAGEKIFIGHTSKSTKASQWDLVLPGLKFSQRVDSNLKISIFS